MSDLKKLKPIYDGPLEMWEISGPLDIVVFNRKDWLALMDEAEQKPKDQSRCAVCGWPLKERAEDGCVRGNCSMRPSPDNFYDPERAKLEAEARRELHKRSEQKSGWEPGMWAEYRSAIRRNVFQVDKVEGMLLYDDCGNWYAIAGCHHIEPPKETRAVETSEGPELCGSPAASFVPRLGQSFACVLPKGHEGDHRPGGTCFKHGPYSSEPGKPPQCPHWPSCVERPDPFQGPHWDMLKLELERNQTNPSLTKREICFILRDLRDEFLQMRRKQDD